MAVSDSIFGGPNNIRLPPDSSGKRSQTFMHYHIEYISGTVDISFNDQISGLTSNAIGDVVELASGNTTTTGTISVVISHDSADNIFEVGEDLYVNGGKVAVVGDIHQIHTNASHIVGGNNPHNSQFIDKKGAAYMRFDDGPQQLDAFGLSRQTTPWMVGFYDFHYDTLPNEFWQNTTTNGTITHLPNEASVALDVTAEDGSYASMTTHKYHLYQPGYSQLIEFTAMMSNPSELNCHRHIGYFDDDNGVFFAIEGNEVKFVLRSKVTGSVTHQIIPQSDWNGDNLSGTGGLSNLSGYNLDVTKVNVFWIDLQWLGAGRVRFGVLAPDGSRVTCHTIENAGQNTSAYMTTATLPFRAEIFNQGVVGGGSRLKVVCIAVKTEGQLLPDRKKRTEKYGLAGTEHTVNSTTDVPILGIRPAVWANPPTNTIKNRKIIIPERWSLINEGDPIVLKFWRRVVGLTGGTWTQISNTVMEVNGSATSFTDSSSHTMLVDYYDAGSFSITAPQNFGYLGQHGRLHADGTTQEEWLVTAALATSTGTSATFTMGFSWIELE